VKKAFINNKQTASLAAYIDELLQEIHLFESYIPLAVCLSNEGMQKYHWEVVSMRVKAKINPLDDIHFTFK